MRVAGIDPGISGAMALISNGEGHSNFPKLSVCDVPLRIDSAGKKQIDCRAYRDQLRAWQPDYLYFENVHAFLGQGIASAGIFMRNAGILEGIAACEVETCHLVTPVSWKRRLGLLKTTKADSIALVVQLFPNAAQHFNRAKDHNRADAALIAVYGAQRVGMIDLRND